MSFLNLNDYLVDLNDMSKFIVNNHINENINLKRIIVFFVINKIKFYYKENNKIKIKSLEFLLLELENLKKKNLQKFLNKILEVIDKNYNYLSYLKTEMDYIHKFLSDIIDIEKLLKNDFNLIKDILKNNYQQDNIIEYNNNLIV